MKNTTGLYKHQRDNRGGTRRKLPPGNPSPVVIARARGLVKLCPNCGEYEDGTIHFMLCVEDK